MLAINIKTTRTTKRWNSSKQMEERFDHTHTLRSVNGKLVLKTITEKDGKHCSSSPNRPIEANDSLIEELFFGLKFSQVECDGTFVFENGKDLIHLVTAHAVNLGSDTYTI